MRICTFTPAAGFLVVLFVFANAAAAADRPNIVLIMCDDMGYSDIGCFGSEIDTPHIDRLAAEGLRFTQFYNNAKCTTTRASLITGLYPRRKGGLLQENMVTIPQVLAQSGYDSVLSGKWHLGSRAPNRPGDRGFDNYYGLLDGCCNFFNPARPDPDFKGGRVRWFGEDDRRITEFPEDFYTTDAFTDYACKAIDRAAADDRPLFLHVCYTAPHYPLHAPADLVEKYRGRYRQGWEQLRAERYRRQLELGLVDPSWELPPPDDRVPIWDNVENQDYHDHLMAVYAAMIDRMDQGIGRILARLDEQGIADNTVVIFLSDNGGCAEKPGGIDPQRVPGVEEYYTACGPGWAYAQNTPFRRFKAWVHEGGISTPLIVRWPSVIEAGTTTDAVGHIIDLLPTCAEIAGAKYPDAHGGEEVIPCEGLSMVPLFEGDSREGHESLFWEWAGNRAVRTGHWKLCWDKTVKQWELYNVVQDRTEMHNLAADHPGRVAEMSAQWREWAGRTGIRVR
ncbi:Arylsulfatase [Maioricimonas rarisocia]|uniref:Arylsulfatase n=1 Tax=Maioricimonas rarisocia TaxID=2528026 RepID=A0A517Z7N2_9PLAN|nr:arylsulfatase [Maioricimonas rarisocia]QDU38441.1 Arylsulfatase [Maioricimonas rarisocia]